MPMTVRDRRLARLRRGCARRKDRLLQTGGGARKAAGACADRRKVEDERREQKNE